MPWVCQKQLCYNSLRRFQKKISTILQTELLYPWITLSLPSLYSLKEEKKKGTWGVWLLELIIFRENLWKIVLSSPKTVILQPSARLPAKGRLGMYIATNWQLHDHREILGNGYFLSAYILLNLSFHSLFSDPQKKSFSESITKSYEELFLLIKKKHSSTSLGED